MRPPPGRPPRPYLTLVTRESVAPPGTGERTDRPHIIRNPRTGKYVCWLKIMNLNDTQTSTVLVADSLLGRPPAVREAPAYFGRDGKHYLITSGTTGYFPNPSQVAVADSFHGPWTMLGDPHPGDTTRTSYRSQVSSVFRHPGKRDLYIALGDRWLPRLTAERSNQEEGFRRIFAGEPAEVIQAEAPEVWGHADTSIADYVWLPISFDGDIPRIDWRDEWSPEEFD